MFLIILNKIKTCIQEYSSVIKKTNLINVPKVLNFHKKLSYGNYYTVRLSFNNYRFLFTLIWISGIYNFYGTQFDSWKEFWIDVYCISRLIW